MKRDVYVFNSTELGFVVLEQAMNPVLAREIAEYIASLLALLEKKDRQLARHFE